MFLLPAILVVVPMLSCAWPSDRNYYLLGKYSAPSIYRGIFPPTNSGKTRHSSPITAGYNVSFVSLQPEQSLSCLRFVLFSIWWPSLFDSIHWPKSASPGLIGLNMPWRQGCRNAFTQWDCLYIPRATTAVLPCASPLPHGVGVINYTDVIMSAMAFQITSLTIV